jgi:hypothetical protein
VSDEQRGPGPRQQAWVDGRQFSAWSRSAAALHRQGRSIRGRRSPPRASRELRPEARKPGTANECASLTRPPATVAGIAATRQLGELLCVLVVHSAARENQQVRGPCVGSRPGAAAPTRGWVARKASGCLPGAETCPPSGQHVREGGTFSPSRGADNLSACPGIVSASERIREILSLSRTDTVRI